MSKRLNRNVSKKWHWFALGVGFSTRRAAIEHVAIQAAVFRLGGTGADCITVGKYFRRVLAEIKRTEAANK